jgi:hypothetical protein
MSSARTPLARQIFLVVGSIAVSWYAMMTVHESGHVLGALVTGGRVCSVSIPLLDFSRTDLARNPHPLFVAAAGPMFGVVLPLAIYGIVRATRWRWPFLVAFFAGFCAIANGAYIAAGAIIRVGDADDMLRSGAPAWALIACGVPVIAVGLYCWHGLGPRFGLPSAKPNRV